MWTANEQQILNRMKIIDALDIPHMMKVEITMDYVNALMTLPEQEVFAAKLESMGVGK